MRIFLVYLKQYRLGIGLFFLFCAVFAAAFYLYHCPAALLGRLLGNLLPSGGLFNSILFLRPAYTARAQNRYYPGNP